MKTPDTSEPFLKEPPDFSLVLGGPLYQLWRRTRLSGDALEWAIRRIVVLALLAWVPLLVLAIAEGHAWGGSVKLPFLQDIEMHVRLLVAVPLLIAAEPVVHRRMRLVLGQFLARGLIPDAERAKFDTAITPALRLRNSVAAEVLLIAFVYVVGMGFIWRTQAALDISSWYGVEGGGKLQPSLAGWWMGCVSLPIFQFLLLRWYFRLFIWARFQWQISRLELSFMPIHPDRCGGIGFLSLVSEAFSPVLFAQGAMLAGMMAERIFFAGAKLPEFKMELTGMVVLMVFAILGPLLSFIPKLAAFKRTGLSEYGVLAQRYAREFDHKWLRGHSVSRRSRQQLRGGEGNEIDSLHPADRAATGRDHPFACGTAAVDDDADGRATPTSAQDFFLTMSNGLRPVTYPCMVHTRTMITKVGWTNGPWRHSTENVTEPAITHSRVSRPPQRHARLLAE